MIIIQLLSALTFLLFSSSLTYAEVARSTQVVILNPILKNDCLILPGSKAQLVESDNAQGFLKFPSEPECNHLESMNKIRENVYFPRKDAYTIVVQSEVGVFATENGAELKKLMGVKHIISPTNLIADPNRVMAQKNLRGKTQDGSYRTCLIMAGAWGRVYERSDLYLKVFFENASACHWQGSSADFSKVFIHSSISE